MARIVNNPILGFIPNKKTVGRGGGAPGSVSQDYEARQQQMLAAQAMATLMAGNAVQSVPPWAAAQIGDPESPLARAIREATMREPSLLQALAHSPEVARDWARTGMDQKEKNGSTSISARKTRERNYR